MDEHGFSGGALLWFAGWLVAVAILFAAGLRIPLQPRAGGWRAKLHAASAVAAGIGVCILGNVAIVLHDTHVDVTREKVYTPSAAAMHAVDALDRPVSVTYFYRSQDPVGRRTRDLLEVMGRRNPLLRVTTVDPDKEPTLARTQGVRIYNAAVVEAEGRRVLVQSTDEAEIALGMQRVLRQRVIAACFVEGHGELPMDNMEFHTHLEGVNDHSHGESSSQIVEMPGHGIGRLRRALEAQGYEARRLILAGLPAIPADCTSVIVARPLTTLLPAESAALSGYLRKGGAALFMIDLGYWVEPGLARLLAEIGVVAEPEVVVDPLAHYMTDAEMVAVTGYDPHPITRTVSLTFFPGIRPLRIVRAADGVTTVPLLTSSRDSYTRPVQPPESRAIGPVATETAQPSVPRAGPRVLGAAAEGTLPGGTQPMRAIVVGDGDFASNSFFPYMSNSDLAVAMLRWLVREERATAVASRVPVPPLILLTGRQTQAIFLTLVVVLPLSVVVLGFAVWWRRR
ncbi:MAG: GldG family protein [Alphaproteobacteria bacterium]